MHIVLKLPFIATAGLPLFWRHPQNQFVNNNDKVIFDCFANGSDSLNITWEKDRRSFTSDVTQVTTHSNGVSSSLTLDRTTVADSGKYQCRATDVDRNSVTSNEGELLSKLYHCFAQRLLLFTCSSPTHPHQS